MNKILTQILCFLAIIIATTSNPIPATNRTVINMDILYGDKFEGDIMLTKEQEEAFAFGNAKNINRQTGLLNTARRWPHNSNRNAIVPYRFQPGYSKC